MLCVLGDLNGWVLDRMRVEVNVGFGFQEENDKGSRVIEFLAERG